MSGRLEASSELEGDVAAFGQVIRQFQWKAERRILILSILSVEGILWDVKPSGLKYSCHMN